MVKYFFLLIGLSIFAASCLKSNSQDTNCPYTPSNKKAVATEVTALQTYIDTNAIDAVKDSAGFFYKIVTPGTGTDSVGLCSLIRISYRGTLLNGNVFDEVTSYVDFPLGSLIEGWQKGIPKLKRGGEMKLYIPPSLGYGNEPQTKNGQVVIPAGSYLIFNVKLIDYTSSN